VPERPLTTVAPEPRPHATGAVRVRLVTWDDDPPVGGQGVYASELRAALSERGIEVSTLAGRGSHAVKCRRITGRGHLDLSIRINADPGLLMAGEPDLVHMSGGPGGLQLLRRLPVPVVFTAHHTYSEAHGRLRWQRALSPLESAGYRRAAAVVAVSPATAQAVVRLGVPPQRVRVIAPGIRGRSPDAPVERESGSMLFVGRLEPEKGPLDALEAMRRVIEARPMARGLLVGAGSLEDVVRGQTGADDRITLRSHLSDEELATEYRRAQVVLMPSQFEGLGLVALEAMAAGAAVVGYDVVGLRDTIGADGMLVPAGNVAELAATCQRLMETDSLREELTARAAIAIRERHSWSRCAAEFEELYRQVLDRPRWSMEIRQGG
jgi:glycosyltransferase involved in cell wall biosynthesis